MKLVSLKNIGKELQTKLETVGVSTAKELQYLGSKDVYRRLKYLYPNVCLVHLYALQGAIDGIEMEKLPEAVKKDLKQFNDNLKISSA